MSDITSKAAYLKGLADGMELDAEKNEIKLLNAIIDFLGEAANEIKMLDEEQEFITDKLDDIDDELDMIVEDVYDDSEDYEEDEDDLYTIVCDGCGKEIDFAGSELDDIIAGEFECPYCGKTIELDLDDLDCDCNDCNCDCEH